MQIKSSSRGILTDASKLAERNEAIAEAVRQLNLASELICENPNLSLEIINDARSMNLKEVEYICDTLSEFAGEILGQMNEAPDSAAVFKFERPPEPKEPEGH